MSSTQVPELATELLERFPSTAERRWQALHYFGLYRLVISGLFAVLGLFSKLPPSFAGVEGRWFVIATSAYLSLAIVAQVLIELRSLPLKIQVYGHVVLDSVAILLFIRASGGVGSGFGVLLVVAIAGSSLFVRPRSSVFFAAFATLAVLIETVFGILNLHYSATSYTQAGLLGALLFIVAILASMLAEQARNSEELAARRAVDIANLSRLNEYIVQRMRSGIIVLGEEGQPVLVNQAALTMLSDANSDDAPGRLPDNLYDLYQRWLVDRINYKTPFELAGVSAEVIVSFTPLGDDATGGALMFLEDAAEMRQRAQQMKLASLGRLTGSIAHEIRNPLGAISHAGQLLAESPSLNEQDRRLTEIIAMQSQRMNSIIENVMTIGRRRLSIAESFPLRDWLEEFVRELSDQHQLVPGDIEILWSVDDMNVRMDKSQLHQVLRNLCENALRYSQRAPLLSFSCGIDRASARPYLQISDQGVGMSDDVASQIFEPFYTGESTGTGLGLFIARELCESNQASLILAANSENGCSFRITFAHPDRQQLSD